MGSAGFVIMRVLCAHFQHFECSETVWDLIPLCAIHEKCQYLRRNLCFFLHKGFFLSIGTFHESHRSQTVDVLVLSVVFFPFIISFSVSVCSSQAGVSWRWCCRTLWRAVRLSSVCRPVRQWSCLRDPVSGRAGVWYALQRRAHLRRVWCPARHSVYPTPAAVSRWTASSLQAKVRIQAMKHFFLCVSDCQMCSCFILSCPDLKKKKHQV